MKSKLQELILPCISVGVILFIASFIKSLFLGNVATTNFYEVFDSALIKDLWFLKSLFCCYLLATMAYSNKKFSSLKICLTILVSFFLNFYMIKRMYLFFVLGILLNTNFELFKKHAKAICTCSFMAFIILLSHYDKNIFLTEIGDIEDAFASAKIKTVIKTLGLYFYNILTGLTGCTSFISLFYLLDNKFSSNFLVNLAKLGQFTLGIYITQYIILEHNFAHHFNFNNSSSFNLIIAPLLSMVILAVCYGLTRFISRNNTTRFLLLGKP